MRRHLLCVAALLLLPRGALCQQPPAPLTVTLFFSPTCPHCHPVRALIKRIQARHPQVRSVEYNLADPTNVERMAAAYQRYRVPEEQWGGTIAVFVGDRWFNDGDEVLRGLAQAVEGIVGAEGEEQPADRTGKPAVHGRQRRDAGRDAVRSEALGAPRERPEAGRDGEPSAAPGAPWEPPERTGRSAVHERQRRDAGRDAGAPSERQEAGAALRRVFEGFGVAAIVGAGLVDGINPCALGTLVFLLSYLGYRKHTPREVLATGLLFGAGVFLSYLGLGLGLFRALQLTAGISVVSRLLYPALAAGTLALAGLSFRDYLLARRGRYREMSLQLPGPVKRLSHAAIRRLGGGGAAKQSEAGEGTGEAGSPPGGRLRPHGLPAVSCDRPAALGPGFLLLAFATGAVVSVLELLCTGQIYLPTLMYMWSCSHEPARVLALLVLYVLMFTLPVAALTLLAYLGVRSQALAALAQRHLAAVKLATAAVFLLLTAFLAAVSLGVV